ncbi:MAG: threonylcarbamoyl-AMP synthase [Duncaniella sp.]|nr:threonylcarbamoyl-AMP synthase [Duncaniella sp.]
MNQFRLYSSNINQRYISEAVKVLEDGGVVLYPTDSVYALGCSALDNQAIERLCRFKGVDPRKQTLSIICSDLSMASRYARIDNEAYRILHRNLPGAFTFVLPAATTLPKVFKGRKTVGIRIPDCPIAVELAASLGHPLLTTSAVDAEHFDMYFAEIADSHEGICDLAIEEADAVPDQALSTVVDLTDSSEPVIIRQGRGELA